MKKSKLFIGTAALLLAVAGAFAAKKASSSGDMYYFSSGAYQFYENESLPCPSGSGCKQNVPGVGDVQMYLHLSGSNYEELANQ